MRLSKYLSQLRSKWRRRRQLPVSTNNAPAEKTHLATEIDHVAASPTNATPVGDATVENAENSIGDPEAENIVKDKWVSVKDKIQATAEGVANLGIMDTALALAEASPYLSAIVKLLSAGIEAANAADETRAAVVCALDAGGRFARMASHHISSNQLPETSRVLQALRDFERSLRVFVKQIEQYRGIGRAKMIRRRDIVKTLLDDYWLELRNASMLLQLEAMLDVTSYQRESQQWFEIQFERMYEALLRIENGVKETGEMLGRNERQALYMIDVLMGMKADIAEIRAMHRSGSDAYQLEFQRFARACSLHLANYQHSIAEELSSTAKSTPGGNPNRQRLEAELRAYMAKVEILIEGYSGHADAHRAALKDILRVAEEKSAITHLEREACIQSMVRMHNLELQLFALLRDPLRPTQAKSDTTTSTDGTTKSKLLSPDSSVIFSYVGSGNPLGKQSRDAEMDGVEVVDG